MGASNDIVERVAGAFAAVDLGDPRRNARLAKTARRMAEKPGASIPNAMGSEAELEGAYRLLRNRRVEHDALLAGFAEATVTRARDVGRVLAVHDTTTCEFAHADPGDVGYLSTGKAGFMAHYTLVIAHDGTRRPLGVVNATALFRERPPSRPTPNGRRERKRSGAETTQDPKRESRRWVDGFARAGERLAGVEVIHVADREGDFYELLGASVQRGDRFVIRVRVEKRRASSEDGLPATIRTLADACEGVLSREVALSSRKASPQPRARNTHPPRAERVATLTFSARRVQIDRPRYLEELPETLSLNLVRVHERQPPPGEDAVEWLLFTTEPIDTVDDIAAVVDVYRQRWLIEECNKALKTGCRYEDRHLESRHALLNLLALSLPIACELLWLRACCRSEPTKPAREVLTPTQLKLLSALAQTTLPAEPSVRDALWAVARLGGHIKSNGEPGWLVLHRGMETLLNYEAGWNARESALDL